jgi:predicted transcriptional regulator
MELLSSLFFELANEDRLNILITLEQNKMKLTNLAKALDLTVQETSRHLQRMSNAMLTEKRPDGAFQITSYGYQILKILPSFDFLVRHKEYFSTHKTEHIPLSLMRRVCEMNNSTLLDNPVLAFQRVNTIINKAKEHLWVVADQVPSGSIPLIAQAVKRGVEFWSLMAQNMKRPDIPDSYMPQYSEEERKRIKVGWTESVAIVGVISENTALIGFPTLDGKMDYLAFVTEDKQGIQWCRDIYLYYWQNLESPPKNP